jgi:uncharacterized membrane protein
MSAAKLPPRPQQTAGAAMHQAMTKVSIVGSIAAGILMLVGFILFLLSSHKIPGKGELHRLPAPTLSQLFTGSEYKSPSAYLGAGLLVLAMTPILRILVTVTHFWHAKDYRHLSVAFGVLAIIALSIFLAWR